MKTPQWTHIERPPSTPQFTPTDRSSPFQPDWSILPVSRASRLADPALLGPRRQAISGATRTDRPLPCRHAPTSRPLAPRIDQPFPCRHAPTGRTHSTRRDLPARADSEQSDPRRPAGPVHTNPTNPCATTRVAPASMSTNQPPLRPTTLLRDYAYHVAPVRLDVSSLFLVRLVNSRQG